MRTICLLIRVKLLKHIQKIPAALRIYVSQEQVDARDALFKLYLDGAKCSELYPAVHKLLVSILCHHTSNQKLACPTDYSVCLASLKVEEDSTAWNFRAPSVITGEFSRLQYCLRMVFFTHCLSIAHHGPDYQAPSLPIPVTTPTPLVAGPPELPTSPPPNPDSILPDIEEWGESEDTLEVIGPTDSQLPEDFFNGQLANDEDDIEVVDNEQDKTLLQ